MNNNETALATIETASKAGSLVCFDKSNGFPQTELYRAEITQIVIDKKNDCYEINKKFMPKKEVVDRIGEAAGIVFVFGKTTTQTLEDSACGKRTVYTGLAQGKIRMSDGTWRTSSICDYGFDPTLRAMLDFDVTELTAQTRTKRKKGQDGNEYGPTLARAILDYQKVAVQRANTGARLRVVRELVTMPIALTSEQVSKPVVFGRIVQNTSYILQTPEGRAMATAQALGVDMATLFGVRKPALPSMSDSQENADTEPEDTGPGDETPRNDAANLAGQAANDEPDFEDDDPAPTSVNTEFARLTSSLEDFINGYEKELNVTTKNGKNPFKLAEDELANSAATEESRRKMVTRLKEFLEAKGIKV